MFGFQPAAGSGSVAMQLGEFIRRRIASGDLAPGLRLPSTRKAAQEMGIARNIVIETYEQLTAEGYLISRAGSGTYVAEGIRLRPETPGRPASAERPPLPFPGHGIKRIEFDAGNPDLACYPHRLWDKCARDVGEPAAADRFAYGGVEGNRELRIAVADYLYRAKGMACSLDQIVITSGTSESFLLIAAAFSDRSRSVFVEEPTIPFARDIFRSMKHAIHPVEVDHHGMRIDRIERSAAEGLLVLTPSHQYPTGSILSIQRRSQAVALAEDAGHYIVEDDYDSEFRHKGRPVPPMQLLAPSRVIYAGTFSKTLSPALRLGFLVVPPSLLEPIVRTKKTLNMAASGYTQSALARFMTEGHFDRHVHRMRAVYKRKRIFLVEQCRRLFGDLAEVIGDEAGMHVQLAFRPDRYGSVDWAGLEAAGVRLSAFDDYALLKGRYPGRVVLGYGNLSEREIAEGLERIRRFIEST